MGIERARLHLGIAVPHRLQQISARQRPRHVAEEHQRKLELLRGQHGSLAVVVHGFLGTVEHVVAECLHRFGRPARRAPAGNRLDTREQNIAIDRLHHEIIRTGM